MSSNILSTAGALRICGCKRVLLIAPKAPPYGGMGIQAALLHELLARDGVPVTMLPSNPPFPNRLRFLDKLRGLRPFLRSLLFSLQLWRALPRTDVVHILACSWLYFFCVVCPAVVIGRTRGKRVVLNYHGGEAESFLRTYGHFLGPIFRMSDAVTVPSGFLERIIGTRMRVPLQVVANIVDFSMFAYRERTPVRPRMLVTRHLEKLYDVESVIRAVAQVQRRYPEASIRIAGTGTEAQNLRQLVSTLGVNHVEFLGHVPYRDLPALYGDCDILVNASRADNFPGSLVEAAASGLVVVSTGVGGIPDLFENGKSALLVEPGDWKALAEAVLHVLEQPGVAARLTREARKQCLNCDWSRVRQRLYAVYGFERETPRIHAASVPACIQEPIR